MKQHLFRYKFVHDNDGSVLRFHNKEGVRRHFKLTKWHLDHALIQPNVYRERLCGVLSHVHEDQQGNAVAVRHVDERFLRVGVDSEPVPVPVPTTEPNVATAEATKPWPFLKLYKARSRPV